MKALSLWRPWAEAILHYGKDVENRAWSTPLRGRILLHSGQAVERGVSILCKNEYEIMNWRNSNTLNVEELPTGLVGTVEIVGCIFDSYDSLWARPRRWNWVLANPRAFAEPIPYRGRQRLFEVDAETMCEVHRQMAFEEDT